ncbi:CoA-transferase [Streptomyces sp. WMMC940]|uniref:CoA-transferase n=1 Tax=Streptomyces sp. WMMC940 TaxID=3015153 RepID=UPI003FCCD92C
MDRVKRSAAEAVGDAADRASLAVASPPEEVGAFDDRDHALEHGITTDFPLVRVARGDRHDTVVLGAVQVSERGDLADRAVPGGTVRGAGGATDLVHGAHRVVVRTDRTAEDGSPELVRACTLPLTGRRCAPGLHRPRGAGHQRRRVRTRRDRPRGHPRRGTRQDRS